MSEEKRNEEYDFSIPPIRKEIKIKRKIKKGWIFFTVIILVIVIFYFSKPYIADYINKQFQTIGHPDGPAYPVDQEVKE